MFSRRPPTDTKLFLQYQNLIRSSRLWFFCWRIAAMGKLWMQNRQFRIVAPNEKRNARWIRQLVGSQFAELSDLPAEKVLVITPG
jgi:hypothetical protein